MKKIKVFFMGRRLCDIYPHATRFQVFKYKVRDAFRKLTLAVLFVGIVFGAFKVGSYVSPQVVVAQSVVETVKVDSLPSKVEELKRDVITRLAACESAGFTEDDGILVFDTNAKASIGVLQFQKTTVIHYYKTLYNKDITAKEAVLIALDKEQAFKLASDVIFTTSKGLTNWVNCTSKLGLQGEVDVIKKLSQ